MHAWEVTALQKIVDCHLYTVETHHKNEDEFFVTKLSKYFKYPHVLLLERKGREEKLTHLHEMSDQLHDDKIDTFLEHWKD